MSTIINYLYKRIICAYYYIISILTRQTAKLRITAYGKETRVVQFSQIGFLLIKYSKKNHTLLWPPHHRNMFSKFVIPKHKLKFV